MGIIGDISGYQCGGESACTTVCGNRPWSKMIALFRENQSGLKMMESGGYLRWGAPPTLLIPVLISLSGRLRPLQLIHSSERRQFSAAQQPLTTFSPLSTRGPSLLRSSYQTGLSCTSRGSLCLFNCLEYSFINTHNSSVPLASHLASENERFQGGVIAAAWRFLIAMKAFLCLVFYFFAHEGTRSRVMETIK